MSADDARLATDLVQPLVGQTFLQLRLGVGDAQLGFSRGSDVTFENPISVGAAPDHRAVPYALDGIALLLPLLNEDVSHVVISPDGEIVLTIGTTTVCCGSDPHYETWNYNGPGGVLVVSTPGGGLAIWDRQP